MIDYEVTGGIAYIRLNRPEKLNAFTNSGLAEYVAALDRLDRDDDAMIGVVTGAGRAFSSGSDVNQRLLEEAFRAGLITAVTPAGQHLEAATALARQVMAHPQEALRETVRYRRGVLAERLQHAAIVAGNFRWSMTDGFKDAIRARAAR